MPPTSLYERCDPLCCHVTVKKSSPSSSSCRPCDKNISKDSVPTTSTTPEESEYDPESTMDTQHRLKWLLTDAEREAILECAGKTISDFWRVEPKGKSSLEKIKNSKHRSEDLFLPATVGILNRLYSHIRETLMENALSSRSESASTRESEDYFVRLSSLSPKDAYLFLEVDEPKPKFSGDDGKISESSAESEVDVAELQSDLNLLKISVKDQLDILESATVDKEGGLTLTRGSLENKLEDAATKAATHAMHVLLHSERVKLDCQNEEKNLYVLLLPWRPTSISGELRLFVKGSSSDSEASPQLLAFSQYFEDLHGCYESEEDTAVESGRDSNVAALYRRVLDYFNREFDKSTLPVNQETGCFEDISLDVDVEVGQDLSKIMSHAEEVPVRLIEFNLLKDADTCFFEKEEIDELLRTKTPGSKPAFRYRKKGSASDEYTEYRGA